MALRLSTIEARVLGFLTARILWKAPDYRYNETGLV